MTKRAVFLFPFLLALAAGCGNPYRQNYVSKLDKRNADELSRILPASRPPKLVSSNDMKADSLKMRENGYLLIGRSQFRSSPIDEKLALDQAVQAGAEVVLVNHKFFNSVTSAIPMDRWLPDKVIQQQETTVIDAPTPTVMQRNSTTVIQGEFQTTYVEHSTDYYDYSASFWAKAKPSLFGVLIKELDEKTKARIGSNKGVLVRAVIKGSPAFQADILRDDILLSVGGEQVLHPDQFFDLVDRSRGKKVPVKLNRNGLEMTVMVVISSGR